MGWREEKRETSGYLTKIDLKEGNGVQRVSPRVRSGGSELGSSGQKGRDEKVPGLAAGEMTGGAPGVL
jgi:hypothetical protein